MMLDPGGDASGALPSAGALWAQSMSSSDVKITFEDLERLANQDIPSAIDEVQAGLSRDAMSLRLEAMNAAVEERLLASNQSSGTPGSDASPFSQVTWNGEVFGLTDEGESLSHQVGAAHDAYVQTLNGIVRDLEQFRTSVRDSVTRAKGADETAQDALVRIAHMAPTEFQMDRAFSNAVEHHGAALSPLSATVGEQGAPVVGEDITTTGADELDDSSPSLSTTADQATGDAPPRETFER